MADTYVELVTPAGTLFSGQAEMVACRTAGGDIAFLADHMPYVGALDPCLVRIVHPRGAGEADELRFDAHDGFVEVNKNRVVILCGSAEPVEG